jgi:hypothetical protein
LYEFFIALWLLNIYGWIVCGVFGKFRASYPAGAEKRNRLVVIDVVSLAVYFLSLLPAGGVPVRATLKHCASLTIQRQLRNSPIAGMIISNRRADPTEPARRVGAYLPESWAWV